MFTFGSAFFCPNHKKSTPSSCTPACILRRATYVFSMLWSSTIYCKRSAAQLALLKGVKRVRTKARGCVPIRARQCEQADRLASATSCRRAYVYLHLVLAERTHKSESAGPKKTPTTAAINSWRCAKSLPHSQSQYDTKLFTRHSCSPTFLFRTTFEFFPSQVATFHLMNLCPLYSL